MKGSLFIRSQGLALAGIAASAVLSGLYLHSGVGWFLGFAAFVPWLLSLNEKRTIAGTLLNAYAMCVAYTLAVFAWLGIALGNYTQVGATTGLVVLLLAAPLLHHTVVPYEVTCYDGLPRTTWLLGLFGSLTGVLGLYHGSHFSLKRCLPLLAYLCG